MTGFQSYRDIERYHSNEIGGIFLGYKAGIHGTSFALGALLANPEPLVTKISFGVLCAVMATDYLVEANYEAIKKHNQQLLESIERYERFYSVKNHLIKTSMDKE